MLVLPTLAAAHFKDVSPKESAQLIQEHADKRDLMVLDVRTPEEYKEGHIDGAFNIDFHSDAFEQVLKGLDAHKTYLVHCQSGGRSAKTLKLMKKLGFEHVYHLKAGMKGWRAAKLSVVGSK